MIKVVVGDFKRGDANEVLNSIANFNVVVLKAYGLEAVAYLESDGSENQEEDLSTDWYPRTSKSSCR